MSSRVGSAAFDTGDLSQHRIRPGALQFTEAEHSLSSDKEQIMHTITTKWAGALIAATVGPTALAATGSTASAGTPDQQPLFWWDGSPVDERAVTVLERNHSTAKVALRELPAGHAITVWAIVFEHPELCDAADAVDPGTGDVLAAGAPGCGEHDVVRAFLGTDNDIDLTATFAAGGVTNQSGKLRVVNRIGGGDTLIGNGYIDNPHTAEVHFVVRDHGPDQPGDEDTTTFVGGCTTELPPGTVPSNTGECSDVQFSVHLA
jgi:hypothetical protein